MRSSPAAEVEDASGRLVSRLLHHAAAEVSFYRPLAPTLVAAAAGERDAWRSLPILTNADIDALGDRLRATSLPAEDHWLDAASWSSISTPCADPCDVLSDVADKAQWEYVLHDNALDGSGRLAAILPASSIRPGDLPDAFGPWSLDNPRGRGYRWSEEFDSGATLRWLTHVRPDSLFVRPEMLSALLDEALPGGLTIPHILVAGLVSDPDAAERCRHLFDGRMIQTVVAPLGGFMASADGSGGFVPGIETALVEIVDEEGRECRESEAGRLVGTALYSYGRVALRQDLGLHAAWLPGRDATGRRHFRIVAAS